MIFASVFSDFEDRVREVDLYFDLLAAIDNGEISATKGIGPQILAEGAIPKGCDNMLKGGAYLVLYNVVEAFIRRGFQEMFDSIKSDQLRGIELSELLCRQWIEQKNRRVSAFDGSPKVYMSIASTIVAEVLAKELAELHPDYLPTSGNLDADSIRDLCDRHGVQHRTSKALKGGSVLTIVRQKRNSLAHGFESFSECGRLTTASELVATKNEVVQYIREILRHLEHFTKSREYHRAWHTV